jgi:hypothetical protein
MHVTSFSAPVADGTDCAVVYTAPSRVACGFSFFLSSFARLVRPSALSRSAAASTKAARLFEVEAVGCEDVDLSPSTSSSTRARLKLLALGFPMSVPLPSGVSWASAGRLTASEGLGSGAAVWLPSRLTRGFLMPEVAPLMASLFQPSFASSSAAGLFGGGARWGTGTPASLQAMSWSPGTKR